MRIVKLIVVSLQRCVLVRKMTLRTLCAYDQYLRTLFMERHPDVHYIPLLHVGSQCLLNTNIGIGNVKCSCWGLTGQGSAKEPNVRGFPFWWNIGIILGPQCRIFALDMYISCCLCQFHLHRVPSANSFFSGIWA